MMLHVFAELAFASAILTGIAIIVITITEGE